MSFTLSNLSEKDFFQFDFAEKTFQIYATSIPIRIITHPHKKHKSFCEENQIFL